MGHQQKTFDILKKQIQTAKERIEDSQNIDDTLMMGNLLENLEAKQEKYSQTESPDCRAEEELRSLLTRLDILILEKKPQARPLAEYIMQKHYRDLNIDEKYLKRFKELLCTLQEQEKKKLPAKVDSPCNPCCAEVSLKQIRVLMADPSTLKDAHRAMDRFIANRLYEGLEEERLTAFISLRERLHKIESDVDTMLKEKEDQEKQKKILYKRCLELQKENKDLRENKNLSDQKLCQLQDECNQLQKIAGETEHYKRLAATILADVFRQNPKNLLSQDRICLALLEYEKISPDGFSAALTPCLREAILTQLQHCLKPYEKLAQEDFI